MDQLKARIDTMKYIVLEVHHRDIRDPGIRSFDTYEEAEAYCNALAKPIYAHLYPSKKHKREWTWDMLGRHINDLVRYPEPDLTYNFELHILPINKTPDPTEQGKRIVKANGLKPEEES